MDKLLSDGEIMKLLIVDDSHLLQERIVTAVSELKNIEIVGQAKNSFEAYKLFNMHLPEIVILDIRLPGENGIKILEKLKAKSPSTKILMFTNYPYPQYKNKCLELGADYFFDKSNDFTTITEVIGEITQGEN